VAIQIRANLPVVHIESPSCGYEFHAS
jgi:hypothetical protein